MPRYDSRIPVTTEFPVVEYRGDVLFTLNPHT